jgi:hypothetical protein
MKKIIPTGATVRGNAITGQAETVLASQGEKRFTGTIKPTLGVE